MKTRRAYAGMIFIIIFFVIHFPLVLSKRTHCVCVCVLVCILYSRSVRRV